MGILNTIAFKAVTTTKRGRVAKPKTQAEKDALKLKNMISELRDGFQWTKANVLKIGEKNLHIDFFRLNVKPRSNVEISAIDDRKIPGYFECRLKNGNSINLDPSTIIITEFAVSGQAVTRNADGTITLDDEVEFTFDPSLSIPSEVIGEYNNKKKEYTLAVKSGTYEAKPRGRQVNPDSARQVKLAAKLKKQAGTASSVQVDAALLGNEVAEEVEDFAEEVEDIEGEDSDFGQD